MHAIIMGAGEGTRMWPLSSLVNKHLLKLGGKPVIRVIFDKIWKYGHFQSSDITIICLEKDEKDYKWEFRDIPNVNFYVIDYNTGTAHEFYNTLLDLATINRQDFFLHYGDTITDLHYGHLINLWNERKPKAMIAITKNIKHDYSQVITDGDRVTEIIEKPNLAVPSWTGIGIFNADYFMDIYQNTDTPKEGSPYLDFGYHILPNMVKDGGLYAYEYNGRWFDVGNLRSYQKLYAEYQNKDLNL